MLIIKKNRMTAHLYYYRLNWTPLSPVTIINNTILNYRYPPPKRGYSEIMKQTGTNKHFKYNITWIRMAYRLVITLNREERKSF